MDGFGAEARRARRSGGTEWTKHDRARPCSACAGQRLSTIAMQVRFRGPSNRPIAASEAARREFVSKLKIECREQEMRRELPQRNELRMRFCESGGLGYLQLD